MSRGMLVLILLATLVGAAVSCAPGPPVAEHTVSDYRTDATLRREVFARFGGFDPRLRAAQFVDWLAAARSGGLAVAMIDRVVLLRRLHGENLGLLHPELRGEYLEVVRRHLGRGRRAP